MKSKKRESRPGAIPVVRLGRRTLVRRTDVDAIIARGGLVDAA